MKIEIHNRWTNACIWSGDIEDTGSESRNLGVAVVAAHKAGADLRGAALSDADLRGADLRGAVLRGAVLRGAVLRGADLSRADLSRANLSDANLLGANLSDANLLDADLSRANMDGASLPIGFRVARLDFGGWSILVTPEYTKIGCQKHDNASWLKWKPEDAEIRAMATGAREFWRQHKDAIRAVIRDVMGSEVAG